MTAAAGHRMAFPPQWYAARHVTGSPAGRLQ